MPEDPSQEPGAPGTEPVEQSSQPAFVRFFFNPQRPVWLRGGVAFMLMMFFAYPFIAQKPQRRQAAVVPNQIDQDSFPDGGSGLADTDVQQDTLRVLLADQQRKQAAEQELRRRTQRPLKTLQLEETKAEEKQAATPAAIGPFHRLSGHVRRPVALSLGPNNDVWAAGTKSLYVFAEGDSTQPKRKLDRATYDSEFNDDLPSITALFTDSGGTTWLGFNNGQLMKYERYEWKILGKAFDPIRVRIFDFAEIDGEVFAASKGMWYWDESFQRLISKKGLQGAVFTSFSRANDGTWFASGGAGVWRYNDAQKSWSVFWKPLKQDGTVFVVKTAPDGTLLAGTQNGLLRLSKEGVVVDRMLTGERISAIAFGSGNNMWVGTSSEGLHLWNGQRWHSVSTEQGIPKRIDSLLVDSKQQLWLASRTSKGVLLAPEQKAAQWMGQFAEEETTGDKPQFFADACEAAYTLLKGITFSGGVSSKLIDGRLIVFFDGRQICPGGIGYHRTDGLVALIDAWNLTFFVDQHRSTVKIPEEFAADKVTVLFVDSKNRFWLGTDNNGVYRYADEAWVHYGSHEQLLNNPVRSIIEDPTGGIWIGTTPVFDKSQRTFHVPPLHSFSDTDGWLHLSPKDGLAHWGVYGLAVLRNKQLFAATTGGISVINERGEITSIGKREGVDPQFAYGVSLDLAGNPWFPHQYFGDGVSWFTGDKMHRVDKSTGLFDNRIVNVTHDRKNRVWIIASDGSIGIYPRSVLEKSKKTVNIPTRKQVELR